MYHVTGTGLTILILYFISYLFYRLDFYNLSFHRKLWNSILAVAFIVSALAGLFMALQISYKWNIPNIKTILRWHVEFGIGMATTGILHFIWHLSYFTRILSANNTSDLPEFEFVKINTGKTEIGLNLFVTGFVSSSIQLLMIREMMNISGGYELISGIFLGSWLILSAAGSIISGRSALIDIRKINLVFALSPVISIFLMFLLGRLFLENGETPSVTLSIIYILLVLIPFCISSGFIFVKLLTIAGKMSYFNPGKSFSVETTGGIFSGIIVSLLISEELGTYKMMLTIITLSIAYVLLTYYIRKDLFRFTLKIITVTAVSLLFITKPDVLFRQIMLPGINITESIDTPYGNLTIGEYMGEKSIYYNQRLLKYSDDVIEREEDIHYAMLQHNDPESVVIISGIFDSHLQEILKYPVKKITYIERDPVLTSILIADSLSDRVTVSNSDAYTYIRKSKEKADVIIMLVPPPSTLLLNRYYTTEFFEKVYAMLNEGGIFMCSPGVFNNYMNEESLKLNSSVFTSIKKVFRNVTPVAGNKLYFIASENRVKTNFSLLTTNLGLSNLYVSEDYLYDDLTEKKSKEIYELLDKEIQPNTISNPLAYSYFQAYNLSRNRNEKALVLILLFLLFALPLLAINRKNITMYFTASSLAGFEIIALLMLQVTAGNMYQMTGLIIAGLMAGLATGSGAENQVLNKLSLNQKGTFLILFYLSVALFFNHLINTENRIIAILLILILSFIPALITGNIFREITQDKDGIARASGLYSADLSGSAIGFIAIAGFAVPAFGIIMTIYFLAFLVFMGFMFGTIMNKQ